MKRIERTTWMLAIAMASATTGAFGGTNAEDPFAVAEEKAILGADPLTPKSTQDDVTPATEERDSRGETPANKVIDASVKKAAEWENPDGTRVVPKVPAKPKVEKPKAEKPKADKAPVKPTQRASKGRTIVEFQGKRETERVSFTTYERGEASATLTNLHPAVNAWFVLEVEWGGKHGRKVYHIENAYPTTQTLSLEARFNEGLILKTRKGQKMCTLWAEPAKSELMNAEVNKPYTPLCDGRLYLRNRIEGYRTTKEWVVEFLRDNMWAGEEITSIIKKTVFKDEFLLQADIEKKKAAAEGKAPQIASAPNGAEVAPEFQSVLIEAKALGMKLKQPAEEAGRVQPGRWYETTGVESVYVSSLQSAMVSKAIIDANPALMKGLDAVEKSAQAYLVAFDLSKFEVGFANGTEHPRLGWSERVRENDRIPGFPGPDGFDVADPLVATGLLSPRDARRVVATFTGGFKRSHGAFKWGELSKLNHGSHYGFIEQGVVFSSLNPFLATIAISRNGDVSMKTWREEDAKTVSDLRFARQNGVAIIDYDPETKTSMPGKFVTNWMHGNWSGSEDMKFRTLRAGICLQETKHGKYLIYGYFSSMTPPAMALIFQSYGCKYAMHLDMNALEHTYLATYVERDDKNYYPEHLISGMKVLDERFKGNVPRFIGYPDNRDFFYILRRYHEEPIP